MRKVGITGGIGSGKTFIANIFAKIGIPVYSADYHAKRLMNEHEDVKNEMIKNFGKDIYHHTGLNKELLARIIFNNQSALKSVNDIVHPYVKKDFENWCGRFKNVTYVLQEAAILIESGAYKKLDFIITVSAPEKLRIQRVMERDHVSERHVKDRIRNQIDEKERNEKADFIIYNDGKNLLLPQIISIHTNILKSTDN